MAYVDLTASEQQSIQEMLNVLRPSVAEMRRVVNTWKQIGAERGDAKTDWLVALNKLLVTDTVPNTSGLAGAGSVTKGELIGATGIMVDMATVVTTWEDAVRLGLCVRLGGINAE